MTISLVPEPTKRTLITAKQFIRWNRILKANLSPTYTSATALSAANTRYICPSNQPREAK